MAASRYPDAPKVCNRLGHASRMAAADTRESQTFIGAAHRARLSRMDKAPPIKATAHRLARLIDLMLARGQPYVERGLDAFDQTRRQRQLNAQSRKAARLGFQLVRGNPTVAA